MPAGQPNFDDGAHRVVCHLDALLAEQVGVTVVTLSVLKNNRARAVRYSPLTAICDVLRCQPGDILSVTHTGR